MVKQETIEFAAQRIAAAAHAPLKIILFGSYARGDADEGSDLDFLVVEQDIPDPAGEYLITRQRGISTTPFQRIALAKGIPL